MSGHLSESDLELLRTVPSARAARIIMRIEALMWRQIWGLTIIGLPRAKAREMGQRYVVRARALRDRAFEMEARR